MYPGSLSADSAVFNCNLFADSVKVLVSGQTQYAATKATANLARAQCTGTGIGDLDQLVDRAATNLEIITQARV
jgi:hypothetical protein